MRKKRILFFINTLGGGGAEKVLVDLLIALDPNRYDLHLCTVQGGVRKKDLPDYVHHRQILPDDCNKWLRRLVYHLPKRLFCRLFLRGNYDVKVAYLEGFPTQVLARDPDRRAKKAAFVHFDISSVPFVQTYYGTAERCREEYRRFDQVCMVSEQVKEGVERAVGAPLENARVVHNVLDRDRVLALAEVDSPPLFHGPGTRLLAVGRLTEQKAFERLIRAAAELERTLSFELCILGEGEERPELEALIRELGVRSVRLPGYRENPYPLMKQADWLVCSSRYEGYSTVVAEACLLGLPVVTTDCAGMRELLENGSCGIIVENSRQGVEDGLRRVLTDRADSELWRRAALKRGERLRAQDPLAEYQALFQALCP